MPTSTVLPRERTGAEQVSESFYRASAFLRNNTASAVFILTSLAVGIDYLLVPDLNTVTPLVSCGLLAVLLLRRSPAGSSPSSLIAKISWTRILGFAGLHLIIALTAIVTGFRHSAVPAFLLGVSKYLVLLPTFVLLSRAGWRDFSRFYRAEWIAAAVTLITFYPYRIFIASWPWYGQVLGKAVYAVSHLFVSGIQYVPALTPTLVGPNLDVTILFWCGGLQGIKLFQMLFALVLIVDWKVLNPRRAFAAYFAGLATMLTANMLRIVLIFVVGNSFPRAQIDQYHMAAGPVFLALAFVLYLLIVYRWLLGGMDSQPGLASAISRSNFA